MPFLLKNQDVQFSMPPPGYDTRVKRLTDISIKLKSGNVLSAESQAALRQELQGALELLKELGDDIKKYTDALKELRELEAVLDRKSTREIFDQKKAASSLDKMVKILGVLEVKFVRPGKNNNDGKDRESIVSATSSNKSSESKKSPKPAPFTNAFLPSTSGQGAVKRQEAKDLGRQKYERNTEKREGGFNRAKEYEEARAKHAKTTESEAEIRRQLERERAERRDKESRESAYEEAKEMLEKKWKQEKEERRQKREQEWKAKKAEIDAYYDKVRARKDSGKQAYDKAAGVKSNKVTEKLRSPLDYQKSAQNEALQKAREQEARTQRDQLERSKKEAIRREAEEEVAKRRQEAQDLEEEERDRKLREKLREASIRARRENLLRMHQHQSEWEEKVVQQTQVTHNLQKNPEREPQVKQETRLAKESDLPQSKTAARRKSEEVIRARPATPSRRASDPESFRQNPELKKADGRNASSSSRIERKEWKPYISADRAPSTTRPSKVTFANRSSGQVPSGPGQIPNIKVSTIHKSQKNRTQLSNQGPRTSQVQKNIIPQTETEAQKQARYRAQAQKEQEDYIAAEGRNKEDRNFTYEKKMMDARIKGLAMASKVRRLDWDSDEEDKEE